MSKLQKTTVCSPQVLLDAAQEGDIQELANLVSMGKARPRRTRRKQKKQDSDRIPRPMNCFMAYRLEKQKEIVARCPGANHRDISKVVAKWWRKESEKVKQKYRNIAEQAKQQHSIMYPNYKYTPKRKRPSAKKQKEQQPSSPDRPSMFPATYIQDNNLPHSSTQDMTLNTNQSYYLSHPLDTTGGVPSWLSQIPYANPSYLIPEEYQTPETLLLSPYSYGNFLEEDIYHYSAGQQLAPPLSDTAGYRSSPSLGYPQRPSVSFSISTSSSISSSFSLGHETYLGSIHEQVSDLYRNTAKYPGYEHGFNRDTSCSSGQESYHQDTTCYYESCDATLTSSSNFSTYSL